MNPCLKLCDPGSTEYKGGRAAGTAVDGEGSQYMTTYLHDIQVACPHCGGSQRASILLSGNTIGAGLWSDGYVDAPMLPVHSPLHCCPTCTSLYWIHEALGESEPSVCADPTAVPEANEATVTQVLTTLANGFARDRDEELTLRQRTWWTLNHPLRRHPEIQRDKSEVADASENLSALVGLLGAADDNGILVRAEAHRELGNFDACLADLSTITSAELDLPVVRIREAALSGSAIVLQLHAPLWVDEE